MSLPIVDRSKINTTDYSTRVLDYIERYPEYKDKVDQIHTYLTVLMGAEYRPFPFSSTITQCYKAAINGIDNVGFDIDYDDEKPDDLYVQIFVVEVTRFHNTDTAHELTLDNFLELLSTGTSTNKEGVTVELDTCVVPLEPYAP